MPHNQANAEFQKFVADRDHPQDEGQRYSRNNFKLKQTTVLAQRRDLFAEKTVGPLS